MIQTRSDQSGMKEFNTLQDAFTEAERDKTIWKISFMLGSERIRLIRSGELWFYEPIQIDRIMIELERNFR